jgi:hypothetical protein
LLDGGGNVPVNVRLARFTGAAISSILVVSSGAATASIGATDANTSRSASMDSAPMLLNTVAMVNTEIVFSSFVQ